MANQSNIDAFKQHLIAAGMTANTVSNYVGIVRSFLKHVGETRLDRISEDTARSFFAGMKPHTRGQAASVVTQYLRFAMARLPVIVNARGAESPRAPTKKELRLRQRWTADKLTEQKKTDDDLIAKLARKLIDGYLLAQSALKGEASLDDFARYAGACKELIESNLALFMKLSAEGRNIHSAIDERVQR